MTAHVKFFGLSAFHHDTARKHIHKEASPSDHIVLVVTERRRAEGERTLADESVERSEHAVRHVIYKHPGADQDALECHFTRPVCTIPGF